jgi:hypothetical protein
LLSELNKTGLVGPAAGEMLLAGRYRLEERLSEQGGSSIWKAADEALARPPGHRAHLRARIPPGRRGCGGRPRGVPAG